jgi:RimJ/RimL family protein N-acetyltransferase
MLKEYAEILHMTDKKICEVGGNLVLPEYRGNQIMTQLIQLQYDLAIELGFEVIVSTVHPDNIGSVKALKRLGLEFVARETVHEHYLRDLYYKEIG